MSFSVTAFKSAGLKQGGFRPALFEVFVARAGGQRISLQCQSTNAPAFTVGQIEVPYFGRKIKIAGDRVYSEWTTMVVEDEDFVVRNALEQWQMQINRGDSNIRSQMNEAYKDRGQVKMFSKSGSVIRTYTLEGLWPVDVGTIELDWNVTDTIGNYTVTWAFDWMNEGT